MQSVRMESPCGTLEIFATARGVSRIDFLEEEKPTHDVPTEDAGPILEQARRELEEYFAGERRSFEVPLDPQSGTNFQREAWDYLRSIPYGESRSYGQQAREMGRPQAMRAVGAANGQNPLPIVIPCHRVISSIGKLHGYAGGIAIKKILLEREGISLRG